MAAGPVSRLGSAEPGDKNRAAALTPTRTRTHAHFKQRPGASAQRAPDRGTLALLGHRPRVRDTAVYTAQGM